MLNHREGRGNSKGLGKDTQQFDKTVLNEFINKLSYRNNWF